jgi:DNA-binding MarR family transcriptional regulator
MINQLLKDVFYNILDIQQAVIARQTNHCLTVNELHVLEAVEAAQPAIMGNVAAMLGVKLSTLTVSVNRLESKNMVRRIRSDNDRRKVWLELTSEGLRYNSFHRAFHEEMVNAVVDEFRVDEIPALIKGLTALRDFFRTKYAWLHNA